MGCLGHRHKQQLPLATGLLGRDLCADELRFGKRRKDGAGHDVRLAGVLVQHLAALPTMRNVSLPVFTRPETD